MTWPAIGKHHEYICEQLKAGVTVTTVHQRLRDERGLAVSIASFRRYVAANVPEEARRSQVKVLRPWPVEPGAEAQIDYGRLGRWLDPVTGKLVTVWTFVMVLACSRHMFVRPVIRLDQQRPGRSAAPPPATASASAGCVRAAAFPCPAGYPAHRPLSEPEP